jgi:histone-lysine N-methyltransferase ASH1L
MLFDQNMIIDATRGSIARFVNHSCEPNCRMVKWIVAGKPRMALFAGDRPIMTGEELTYDYNFDPFSAKNVQECRCGSKNCRGILGPRPKDQKPRGTVGESIKQAVSAGKRKLKEFLRGEKDEQQSPKKRKVTAPIQRSALKETEVPKGLRHNLSKMKGIGSIVVKKNLTKSQIIRKYGGNRSRTGKGEQMILSRDSSLTLVNGSPGKEKKDAMARKGKVKSTSKRSMKKNAVKSVKKRATTMTDVKRSRSTIS